MSIEMEAQAPPINEAVNLLHKYAPQALDRLRQELPAEIKPLLQPGGIAGKVDQLIEARVRVCLVALTAAANRCDLAVQKVGQRLRLARRLRLAGDLAAVFGSSSVLVTAVANVIPGVLAGGFVALTGSLTSVIVAYAGRLDAGKSQSLSDVYLELAQLRYEAQRLHGDLSRILELRITPSLSTTAGELIGQTNVLCLRVIEFCSLLLVE